MKNKKQSIFKLAKLYLYILLALSLSVLTYFIYKLNIIPTKYLITLLGILVMLVIFSIIFIINKNKKLQVVGYTLVILTIIINLVGIYYVKTTDEFFTNSFNNASNEYTNTFHIVVLKNSSYNMSNIKNNELGYYKDNPRIQDALSKLDNEVNKISYNDVFKMFNELGTNINYILIEDSIYTLVFEINTNLNRDNYKIINSIDLTYKEDIKDVNNDTPNTNDNYISNSNNINIYIGGTDFTNKLYDFNMIVSINKDTHKVLLTSIPRDYHIPVYGKGGLKDNIGYHGAWGITTSVKSLENLFNINIDYYVKVNTNSLVGVVNVLDGVNYCSDVSYTTTHALVLNTYDDTKAKKLYVNKGCKTYNGIEILTIARERGVFKTGDRQRQKNCQKIIISIFNKAVSPSNLTNYKSILNSISSLYTTNIPKDVITSYIKDIIDNKSKYTFETQSVNGYDSNGYVHLTTMKNYVMIPDYNSVKSASRKIKSN